MTILFQALQLVNQHRNAYGLRSNDYARYRKHCTNRTHRLRSTLKMTHGKGRDFKKLPPITPDIIKEGHLELLLFEAERAWAHSQDLINRAHLPANKDRVSILRHSATGRFRRAVHWSTQLLSHCQSLYTSSRISAEGFLEASVYTVIVNGRFLRYREEFEDAVIQLSVARGLLDELASTARTSREQALAVLFADEIGPEIRHCAHELGRTKSYDIDDVVADLMPQYRNSIIENCDAIVQRLHSEGRVTEQGGQQTKLRQLLWEGQPVPVRNPELVDVLLKVQEAEEKLTSQTMGDFAADGHRLTKEKQSKKGVVIYDAILSALSDAEDVARKLAEVQQSSGGALVVSSGTRDIHFVHDYIIYQLLSRRIQRDLLLASVLLASHSNVRDSSKRSIVTVSSTQVDSRLYPAVVKLFEIVVQSLDQMRGLSIVDDNPDLASAVEARLSFTKSRRCLYLACCYTPFKKYAEALTLLQHASIHIRETVKTLSILVQDPISSTTGSPFFSLSQDDIGVLENEIATSSLQYKRDWFSHNGGSTTRDTRDYQKPTFFNIALNYVPLNMSQLLERAGKQVFTPAVVTPPVSPLASRASGVAPAPSRSAPTEGTSEKKLNARAKIEEARRATPEPQTPARGGLSGLLGAWWGRS